MIKATHDVVNSIHDWITNFIKVSLKPVAFVLFAFVVCTGITLAPLILFDPGGDRQLIIIVLAFAGLLPASIAAFWFHRVWVHCNTPDQPVKGTRYEHLYNPCDEMFDRYLDTERNHIVTVLVGDDPNDPETRILETRDKDGRIIT